MRETERNAHVRAGRSGRRNLSVVVPCFNEAAVVPEMHRRLVSTLEKVPELDFEIVYVDDGSRDATLDVLRDLQRTDERVRMLALSRNFGQQIASTAGLQAARGDAVVLSDADLQDPPEVILEMLARWRGGVDVAYGVRTVRGKETRFKSWSARTFYRFFNRISDLAIPLDTGDFRLLDRRVVDAFLAMPERDRFIRGMVSWTGFRQEPVFFRRADRLAGDTRFSFKKSLHVAMDGVFSFSSLPLRLLIHVGLLAAGLALAGVAGAVATRLLTGAWVAGWALLFLGVLFHGGVQLVALGILGGYVGRIYDEVKRRPLYLVRERRGFAPGPGEPEDDGG